MANKVFIPPLWAVDNNSGNSLTMSQVSSLVNTEMTKRTADLVRIDGTRSMKGSLDIDGHEVINVKVPESDNALASMKTVKGHWNALNPIFDKTNFNMSLTGHKCTASSQYLPWGTRSDPDNAFDNNTTTEWITGTSGKRSWIKIELQNHVQIWKVSFHPRNGHQRTTQLFTNYIFEASNDDINYDLLLKSTNQIDQIRTFEIEVTKPYKFFKFEGDGLQTMGLSLIELFEVIPMNKSILDSEINHLINTVPNMHLSLKSGNVPFLALDLTGKPIINSTSNLMLDNNGFIYTNSGDIKFGRDIDINFNAIKNVNWPNNVDDGANKQYVDKNK